MHFPSNYFNPKKKRAASERGRKMAAIRWANERRRQVEIASKDPAFTGLKIIRRIVVIENESTVRETTIYNTDSPRSAWEKLKRILSCNE